jgi:hypothetical protein
MKPAAAPDAQRHHTSVTQCVKAVTNHAAAYVQRWGFMRATSGHHIYLRGGPLVPPPEREVARMSARLLVAAGNGPARLPACEHALRGRTKFYHAIDADALDWFVAGGWRCVPGFRGWLDDFDANTRALRWTKFHTAWIDDFSPVVMRALSLFGPGELRVLSVTDIDVFHLVTSLMRAASTGGGPAPQIGQSAVGGLCEIHVDASCGPPSLDVGSLAAVLERHSSSITELNVALPAHMLNAVSSALARCTRLESLTGAPSGDPAVWLGLSQLHTLCGVDLSAVSFAAIAAALQKLHTLKAFGQCEDPARVAGFFTDLLPRLQVFHFEGTWPAPQGSTSTVAPLPLLQELVWGQSFGLREIIAPREFLGAQPTVLRAPYALVSQCWLGMVDLGMVDETVNFLARVSELHITAAFNSRALDPSDVARVLRAAPMLKTFHIACFVHGDASWLAPTAPTHPAFEGLVHPRLREFAVPYADAQGASGVEWVAYLRQRHFPRLRKLIVGDDASFVTPDIVLPEEQPSRPPPLGGVGNARPPSRRAVPAQPGPRRPWPAAAVAAPRHAARNSAAQSPTTPHPVNG